MSTSPILWIIAGPGCHSLHHAATLYGVPSGSRHWASMGCKALNKADMASDLMEHSV